MARLHDGDVVETQFTGRGLVSVIDSDCGICGLDTPAAQQPPAEQAASQESVHSLLLGV
jgi:hypothetical protein